MQKELKESNSQSSTKNTKMQVLTKEELKKACMETLGDDYEEEFFQHLINQSTVIIPKTKTKKN